MAFILPPFGSKIELIINQQEFKPGDTVSGKIVLHCSEPIKARGFSIEFRGEAWVNVSCGSGRSKRGKNETVVFHREAISFGGEKEYSKEERQFNFSIPNDAPPTMLQNLDAEQQYGAGLRWIIETKLDIPLSTDISTRKIIFVY